jgi:hypothetical protein
MSSPVSNSPPFTGISGERRPSTFLRLTPEDPQLRSTFLSLAPDTSPSYPQTQRPSIEAALPRRQSSANSVPRILKLGPVHWGEHQEDHKDDFHPLSPA